MSSKVVSKSDSKSITWSQDLNSINIVIPISGVSMKKIDIFMSDLVLKVNVQENNFLKFFDFLELIDYNNKENTFTYDDNVLECYIIKKTPKAWDTLTVQKLGKEELKKRREESYTRKHEADAKLEGDKTSLKIDLDRHATREIMRIEQQERETIESKKKAEKEEAVKEIYQDLQENAQFNTSQNQEKKSVPNVNKDIFDSTQVKYSEEEVEAVEEPEQITQEIRKPAKYKMKFTEKMYPHLAAREQHFKEPPMPKTAIKKDKDDDDTGNPLYLKDKADEFFKSSDYISALNAYSSALSKDNNFIQALANRSLCFLKLFNYDECIDDCKTIIDKINQNANRNISSFEFLTNLLFMILVKEKHPKMISKLKGRMAICFSWKGNFEEALKILDELLSTYEIEKEDKLIFEKYKECILKRTELNKIKKEADLKFHEGKIEESKAIYEKILESEANHETALANLSLIYYNIKNYEKSIEFCNKTLEIISLFKPQLFVNFSFSNTNNDLKNFAVKLILRKSCALENLNRLPEAAAEIEKAYIADENNSEVKLVRQRITQKVVSAEVEKTKQIADQFIREKKFKEALEIYNECLKTISTTDILTYLALLLNKTICHLALNQFEDIISISIRGLNLITNHRNKVIAFGKKPEIKDLNDKIKDFEVRFLVRRGNAYAQTQKLYHAKSDFEEALKLDPKNQKIIDDLKKLNDKIALK